MGRLHTQVDDIGGRDAANASRGGAHPHADVPEHRRVNLSGVDVDDAEGHGEAELAGHLQRQSNGVKS